MLLRTIWRGRHCHSNVTSTDMAFANVWYGACVFTLGSDRKNLFLMTILFWYSKSYFDIRTESENPILTFKILFWHSLWMGKSYFDIQNPILMFALSRKILFWHSKAYCHIQNPILTFALSRKIQILFWHLLRVGKSYFDIQNPILTFALSRKILFWHSNSQFNIRT